MNINSKKFLFLFIPIVLSLSGCLKDEISPVYNISLSGNALLLQYLEENGDYINSSSMPSIVNIDDVNSNLDNYLIIDIRSSSEYIVGHISGAINVRNDSLVTYLNSIDIYQYPKIVLVSSDGQAASYYTCLLRLYGVSNSYSLLFGMSQWNQIFSNSWTDNVGDDTSVTNEFSFVNYSNDSLSNLPNVPLENSGKSLESKIKERISDIINAGFVSGNAYVQIRPPGKLLFDDEPVSNFYIVCYGLFPFYFQNVRDPLAVGHFPNAVSFIPENSFKSTTNLQLLPDKTRIVIYSYSGQQSAFIAAYLRVLGYDAKSLQFGALKLFYSFMLDKESAYAPFVFLSNDIRNYNYVTGSSPK